MVKRAVRAEFPRELAPLAPAGVVGVTPPTPLRLPGAHRLGLDEGGFLAALGQPGLPANAALLAQAEALGKVLSYVFVSRSRRRGWTGCGGRWVTLSTAAGSELTERAAGGRLVGERAGVFADVRRCHGGRRDVAVDRQRQARAAPVYEGEAAQR